MVAPTDPLKAEAVVADDALSIEAVPARKSPRSRVAKSASVSGRAKMVTLHTPTDSEVKDQDSLPVDEDQPPVSAKPVEAKRTTPIKEEIIQEELLDQQSNRGLRETYADKAYDLARQCIYFWALIIAANAVFYAVSGKTVISDQALIVITTGVTVNVLAAFLGVIRGLFPPAPLKNAKRKKARR